ncbi:putative Ig domain-containing protein [Spirosoma aerolatum]|uniref:putative Ig domain-containing protein n=1 Tax=Spirosoma aerolatum TaxID=1211326 RepID=UPI0009AC7324|nr:putative Ig domain-containing protein [Spirosoma aerolatum]
MFDLVAFIAQLLPPYKRTTTNKGFVQILFAPIGTLLLAIEALRVKLLIEARSTGQVLILQELCNRVAFGAAVDRIYLLDGNTTVDFQVVIPPGLSESVVSNIRGVLDAHKQAGKRYTIQVDADYDVITTPLAWEPGYPTLSSTKLTWAVDQSGSFHTVVVADGETVIDQSFNYLDGVPLEYANNTATNVSITVGPVSATLTRNVASGVINRIGYLRSGNLVMILPNVDLGTVEVKLVGINGTNFSDSYQDASVANNTVSGVTYNRQRVYPTVPNGQYRAYARIKGQTQETTVDITWAGANQPPIVSYQLPDVSGKVGVPFSTTFPLNTFTDPDGTIASIAVSGYPSPLGYTSGSRTLAGTPTTAGTYTVYVTATDNQGATVQDSFVLTIAAADAPDPIPSGTGTSNVVYYNSNVLKCEVQWSNGKARVVDTSGYVVPSGKNVYYFLSGSPYVNSLSTDYEYLPGQTLTVWKVVAVSPDRFANAFVATGFNIIYFGQPE